MSKIYWLNPVKGKFTDAADWRGGVVPGASDDAILNAAGADYTVTVSGLSRVNSIQVASNVTLAVPGSLVATAGTGSGRNAGKIIVGTGSSGATGSVNFYIGGMFDNSGSVVLDDSTYFQDNCNLGIESNTTLTGGGTITLDDTPGNDIFGFGVTLTNVNNTIAGDGAIGFSGTLTLINESRGVINATGGNLEFGVSDVHSTLVNNGVLEDTGGELTISDADVTGHGEVSGTAGGGVFLNGCTMTGQTLSTSSGGAIAIYDGTVSVEGSISNGGALLIDASGVLSLHNSLTLAGGGVVFLDFSTALVTATHSGTVFTNLDNTIYGTGSIGDGKLTFVNEAAGVVAADSEGSAYGERIIIDTGRNTVVNAGLFEANSGAILTLKSALDNTGTLTANGGKLTAQRAVTGSGQATITGGILNFKSSFNEAVTFTNGRGVLKLAQSQSYTAAITGFSADGGTSLDLGDIAFVNADEATFSGTASAGVLTVTDGVHTAHIDLIGDYLGATFTASSNVLGGTTVVANTGAASAPPHAFIAAMAGLAASPAQALHIREAFSGHEPMLTSPRVAIA
jgi:hypothetical protein